MRLNNLCCVGSRFVVVWTWRGLLKSVVCIEDVCRQMEGPATHNNTSRASRFEYSSVMYTSFCFCFYRAFKSLKAAAAAAVCNSANVAIVCDGLSPKRISSALYLAARAYRLRSNAPASKLPAAA